MVYWWFNARLQYCSFALTHWGRATHICVGNLTIIGSDSGLSPGQPQAIIWTNAGILLIGLLKTSFSEILIKIITFSFKKMRLKVSSTKRRPFCFGLNVLTNLALSHWYNLSSTKLLPKPMISCCQPNPQEQMAVKYEWKYKIFIPEIYRLSMMDISFRTQYNIVDIFVCISNSYTQTFSLYSILYCTTIYHHIWKKKSTPFIHVQLPNAGNYQRGQVKFQWGLVIFTFGRKHQV